MQNRWQNLTIGPRRIAALLPGVGLCLLITGAAVAVQALEEHALGHPFVEALVAAILIGILVRTVWIPSELWQAGIAFSAKQLLEAAVALLGASISFAAIAASGSLLIALTAGTVAVTLAASFVLSRILGLPARLSLLIACGNSICGNSAIATIAPLIRASGEDIAASISFTAILGVLIVLGLPLLIPLLGLSATQYGILAGLTVYAVPQVLAATIPAGLVSTHIGTLVKLVRVLMLGPVAIGISVLAPRMFAGTQADRSASLSVFKLVPWFIVSFLALAAARSLGIVPDWIAADVTRIASVLTVLSMAALGLGVDIRVLSSVGARVTAAVTLSLLLLLGLAIVQVRYFQ
jgi:uncharacterized integral membrane protein (TIGR00698 family)